MRLSKPARAELPDKDFAGPGRSFPIPDKDHAHAALMLINKAPASARPKIRAKADAMLGRKGGGMVDEARHKAHAILLLIRPKMKPPAR